MPRDSNRTRIYHRNRDHDRNPDADYGSKSTRKFTWKSAGGDNGASSKRRANARPQPAKATTAEETRKRKARREKAKEEGGPLPRMTADIARVLALMLAAGLPAADAVARAAKEVAPNLPPDRMMELGHDWLNSEILLGATVTLQGGEWHLLDADARLSLAYDKHFAELAYFLMTHEFDSADGTELKKIDSARSAIAERLAGNEGNGDAFEKFMAAALKGDISINMGPGTVPVFPLPVKAN